MTAEQIITIIVITVIGALLIFFLTPTFIFLCEDLGKVITDFVLGVKDAFVETAKKWKYIFKRVTK